VVRRKGLREPGETWCFVCRSAIAFADPMRIIHKDLEHSFNEERYFCFGKIKENILTVRFTFRGDNIRIFGAGYWRKGKKIYEEEN